MAVADHFDTVQKIYIAFYQRPADPAGLKFWAQNIDTAGGDLSAVINAFATSAEATELYGEINEETIGDVIDSIYQGLFGRDADEAGKAYYAAEFAAGNITAGNIALAVLSGAQNDDETAIANKLAVANEFTQQVDGRELTDAAFGTAPFNVTYSGSADAEAARGILADVTADTTTVLTPSEVTAALRSQIADEGDPIGEGALVDQLTAYNAAVEAADEAEAAYSKAVVDAGLLTGADAADADKDGLADGFDNEADYVLEAEQDVLDARRELSIARNGDGDEVEGISDAALNQAVVNAQRDVNEDEARYESALDQVPAGGTAPLYSAAQLQSRAAAAQDALNANIAAGGETVALSTQLEDAIALYVAQFGGEDAGSALLADVFEAADALQVAAEADDEEAYETALGEFYGAVQAAYDGVFTPDDGKIDDSALQNGARGDAVEALLTQLNTRADLAERAETAEDDFEATDFANALILAQQNVEDRQALIDAVTEAQENLAAVTEAADAYEAAAQAVTEAAEALGYEIQAIDRAGEFGTDGADLFLFDADDVEGINNIVINDLGSDDVIYLGSDYTVGTAGSGNNNVLEVFLTEDNGNAVLQIENTAFGSANEGFTEITLTGIALADVTIENGIVSFA